MKILKYPNPILRFKARPLKRVNKTIVNFAAEMMKLTVEKHGIGLAATQVGLPFRLIVINVDGQELALVNPEIRSYGKQVVMEEGCLSMPGVIATVRRRSKCWLKAWSLHGGNVDEEVDGVMARVLQHEIDHLDGMLFTDRLPEIKFAAPPVAPAMAHLENSWLKRPETFLEDHFKRMIDEYCNPNNSVDGR